MKVLLSGATGFIGNYVVEKLLDKGHNIIIIVRSKETAKNFKWHDLVTIKEFDIEKIDLTEKTNLFEYFQKPDKFIHMAWSNLDDFNSEEHIKKVQFHYNFIKRLIEEGLKDLTVAGTCLEYGQREGELSEEDETNPITNYAKAKDELRKKINELRKKKNFCFKWIRLFYIIPEIPKKGTVFWELENSFSNKDEFFSMTTGEQKKDFLPIKTVADNISKISLQDEITGIINCSSGTSVSLKSVLENYLQSKKIAIKLKFGEKSFRNYESMNFFGNNQKLKKILEKYPEETKIYPTHLQIETVNKLCNAKCIMCIIWDNTRKIKIMSIDAFKSIIKNFLPYVSNFKYVTLHGCGEPLLDKTIVEKVKYIKDNGFKGVGFSSNCQFLNENISRRLIEAGIDTLIVSIDGFKKETHESIRLNTNFETIVENVKNFIKIRNEMNAKSRVLIRFIRQQKNYDEWEDYKKFWEQYIDPNKKDVVVKFDVHNCGGRIPNYEKLKIDNKEVEISCIDLYERIIVFAGGEYGFCSADQSGYFDMGNALKDDPIEVFNNYFYNYYRKQIKQGNISNLKHCKYCTIPLSRYYKEKGIPLD